MSKAKIYLQKLDAIYKIKKARELIASMYKDKGIDVFYKGKKI
jgi:hypothetical protein